MNLGGFMKDFLKYTKYFIKNAWFVLLYKIFKKKKRVDKFLGQSDITPSFSDEKLCEYISNGTPFAAARFGAVELSCINNYEKKELHLKRKYKEAVKYSMQNNAGFFPSEDFYLDQYVKMMHKELSQIDLLGISGIHMEDYFYKELCSQASIIRYDAFEPIDKKWLECLKGKKVLIVSSFTDDMEKQLKKQVNPFNNGLLNDIEFCFVKSVLSLGEAEDIAYSNWFEALDAMKMEILKHDFDIALVGAGAYGTPLCTFIKRLNKQAIQTGGATPLLFGIIGKRWETRPYVSKYLTDEWIRPTRIPKGKEKVEKGCYW